MRTLITFLTIAVFATVAFADGNPEIVGYISFDAAGAAGAEYHRYDAGAYEQVTCYVVLANIPAGVKTANFKLTLTPGMSLMNTFTNLMPGDLAIGAYDTGIALASTDCLMTDPLVVASLLMFCSGTPGDILLEEHPDWGFWVDDCDLVTPNYFAVTCNGAILKDPVCNEVPVEETTWGSLKALYR